MIVVKPSVKLRWITPDAEGEIASAARICYQSEDDSSKTNFEMVRHVIKLGHLSVLEHASASFQVVCDRGVSHEIVRHRLASYSQESSRYCNYAKAKFGSEIRVIEPPGLIGDDWQQWRVACMNAEIVYMDMIKRNIPPQIARSVLPTCLKTELRWTANLREWMLILSLRTAVKAHPQMREIANVISQLLLEHVPSVFGSSAFTS